MLDQILKEMNLPALKSREEMLSVLLEEEYGQLPPKPEQLTFEQDHCSLCSQWKTL